MLAPPRDAAQRAATGRLDRAMYPQSLKPDQAAKLCVPLANKYDVPAPSRQIVDIVKARTSNHTLPLAARSNLPGLVRHLVVARLPFAAPNLVEDGLLRALLSARGMGGREIDDILMVRRMEEMRRRLRQGLGRAIRAPDDAATVWIGDPRFPLPEALVRDRRARVSQGLAAPFTSFIATIPVRFREGIRPAWNDARVHGAGVGVVIAE